MVLIKVERSMMSVLCLYVCNFVINFVFKLKIIFVTDHSLRKRMQQSKKCKVTFWILKKNVKLITCKVFRDHSISFCKYYITEAIF